MKKNQVNSEYISCCIFPHYFDIPVENLDFWFNFTDITDWKKNSLCTVFLCNSYVFENTRNYIIHSEEWCPKYKTLRHNLGLYPNRDDDRNRRLDKLIVMRHVCHIYCHEIPIVIDKIIHTIQWKTASFRIIQFW